MVKGFYENQGDFEIQVSVDGSCSIPQNDECTMAQQVSSLPQTFSFNNEFASGGNLNCFGVQESGHSVWYKVTGTGGNIIAHTCDPSTNFQTALAIFRGLVIELDHYFNVYNTLISIMFLVLVIILFVLVEIVKILFYVHLHNFLISNGVLKLVLIILLWLQDNLILMVPVF